MKIRKITKEEKEDVRERVEIEGFDYCFVDYSNFNEIKDLEFHRLRKAYLKAQKELEDYLN